MYKTNNKLKSIVLWMVVTVVMLLPVGASAQDDAVPHGGLFSYYGWFNSKEEEIVGLMRYNEGYGSFNVGTQIFGSDTDGGLNIYTQQFGYEEEETPLGSGCIVLTLAGAAYAFKKRKNNDKK